MQRVRRRRVPALRRWRRPRHPVLLLTDQRQQQVRRLRAEQEAREEKPKKAPKKKAPKKAPKKDPKKEKKIPGHGKNLAPKKTLEKKSSVA